MTITTTQFADWLANPASNTVILIQADHSAGTKYIGSRGLTVGGNYYEPLLRSDFGITNQVSPLEFGSNITFSDIELRNNNGELDSWLSLIWVNKSIRIYVGDASWTDLTNDFRNVFTGTIGNLDAKDRNTLNLTIRSPFDLLNAAITGTTLGNYNYSTLTPSYVNPNKDVLRPLVFGEVFNITPLLVYPGLLEYMVHDGAVEQIIEVRDNGVPVTFYTTAQGADPAIQNAGCFRLAKTPTGVITCDVQGMKESRVLTTGATSSTYVNTAPNIIATIITKYGKSPGQITIDWTSFNTIDASYPTYVGIYVTDRFNIFALCDEIARQATLSLVAARDGKITLIAPRVSPGGTPIAVTDSSMLLNSLQISYKTDIVAAFRTGYAKNWTIQNNLTTGIYQAHKDWYAKEATETAVSDTTVATTYNLELETPLDTTYLVDDTQVGTAINLKLTSSKAPHTVYKMTLKADYMHPETGSALGLFVNTPVTLTSTRFNLSSTPGVVVSTTPNWFNRTIDVEVLV